jgi:hypothetical protein
MVLNLTEGAGIDCQVCYPAKIRATDPRKPKPDRPKRDLILTLLVEDDFSAILPPSMELLDPRA